MYQEFYGLFFTFVYKNITNFLFFMHDHIEFQADFAN